MAIVALTGEILDDVILEPSPLESVITQLTFPVALSLMTPDVMAKVQGLLQDDFPVLRQEQSMNLTVSTGGEPKQEVTSYMRFHSPDHARHVSLGSAFLAYDSTQYGSRDAYLGEFQAIFEKLASLDVIRHIDRLGLRYVNRLTGGDVSEDGLKRAVAPEALGIMALSESLVSTAKIQAAQAHVVMQLEDITIQARWGHCPAGQSYSPGVRPVDDSSWLVDIDCFVMPGDALTVDQVARTLGACSEKAYAFFRWVMSDDFVEDRRSDGK